MTATARAERRLAAIVAADVVGYARLVEQDEETGKYRLGMAVFQLGSRVLENHPLRHRSVFWADALANRTRQSANSGLRVFITSPMIPEGRPLGISDFRASPRRIRGKPYSCSHLSADNSRQTVTSPALEASNMALASPK